ncbi:DUF2169 domain-containing protein [Sphingomonas sp. NCPPB 2930]
MSILSQHMDSLLVGNAPLSSRVFRHEDSDGAPYALLVSKGTWDLRTGTLCNGAAGPGAVVEVRDVPLYTAVGDLQLDETQRAVLGPRLTHSILAVDHDRVPPKPHFDVVVNGYAHAPGGKPKPWFDAGIRVGNVLSTLRAYGPRIEHKRFFSSVVGDPLAPVRRVPLGPAFAGWGRALETLAAPADETTFPMLSPWLEAIGADTHAADRGPQVSFGTWSEEAPHRLQWAGTYDERWRCERAPRLPRDFDRRFYNTADPALQLRAAPVPGTPIRLAHLSENSMQDIVFPAMTVDVSARYGAGTPRQQQFSLRADTLLLEPDLQRMAIVWRALIPVRGGSLQRLELHCRTGTA